MKLKKKLRVLLIILGAIIGVILIAAVFTIQPLDRTPYKETYVYPEMKKIMGSIQVEDSSKSRFRAGWDKQSLIPKEFISLAGYGPREKFKSVHDSIWCRTFIFDNGKELYGIVSLDLLIFPPIVTERLLPLLPSLGIAEKNLLLTAIHTHSAPGGWAEGLGGKLLAGGYNEEYVELITNAIITSIQNAKENLGKASIGFDKADGRKIIYNRLSNNIKDLDYWIRLIRIKKESGENAIIVSYAGHPTSLEKNLGEISGDYTGALVDSIEKKGGANFAAFFAGAVAAHACQEFKKKNYGIVGHNASYLFGKVKNKINNIELNDSIDFSAIKIPLLLREPQLKIAPNWKIRPWLFNSLFGKQDVYISALRLGDIALIGMPCDFSGELAKDFSAVCQKRNIKLVVLSFNGSYIGYVVPDKYYDKPIREPRDMDWYGPYCGSYMVEVTRAILEKI